MEALVDLCHQFVKDPETNDSDFVEAIMDALEHLDHGQLVMFAKAILGWGRPL